jgi:hypothetical protein
MPRLTNKQYLARRAFLAKIRQTAFLAVDRCQKQALYQGLKMDKRQQGKTAA